MLHRLTFDASKGDSPVLVLRGEPG